MIDTVIMMPNMIKDRFYFRYQINNLLHIHNHKQLMYRFKCSNKLEVWAQFGHAIDIHYTLTWLIKILMCLGLIWQLYENILPYSGNRMTTLEMLVVKCSMEMVMPTTVRVYIDWKSKGFNTVGSTWKHFMVDSSVNRMILSSYILRNRTSNLWLAVGEYENAYGFWLLMNWTTDAEVWEAVHVCVQSNYFTVALAWLYAHSMDILMTYNNNIPTRQQP